MRRIIKLLLFPIIQAFAVLDRIFYTDYSVKIENKIIGFHKNDYRFPKSQVAFIHVPKTGGTTINHLLNNYPHRFTNLFTHRPISLKAPPKKYKYAIFLRNPLNRVWSYYQMAKQRRAGNPYHYLTNKGLHTFLQNCWEVNNLLCRYLSGHVHQKVNQNTFELALKNLENIFFIGSFKNLEDDIKSLVYKCNIDITDINPPHFRKSSKPKMSKKEKQLIKEYNQYDIQLYRHFCQIHL